MKSQLPKVLHSIGGLTLIERVLRTAAALQPTSITMVVGHGADEVQQLARQANPAPVRHAGAAARNRPRAAPDARRSWKGRRGPSSCSRATCRCSRSHSLKALLATHAEADAAATVITANLDAAVRLRPHRSHQRRDLEDRRGARRHRRAEGDHRNQFRHLRLRARAAVRRARHASAPRTSRASTTCPISSRSTASRSARWRRGPSNAPTRFAASTAVPNLQRSAPWFASRRTKS